MALELRSWSPRMLRAVLWVSYVVGPGGEEADVAHASWRNLPLAGTVDFTELQAAERALVEIGLMWQRGNILQAAPELVACAADGRAGDDAIELVLALVLEREAPLWLRTAVVDGAAVRPELLPDAVSSSLNVVIPDADRREAFLLARANRVEARERKLLGEEGEEAVVAACRAQLVEAGAPELAVAVRRVSLVSDELGFDVTAPCIDGSTRRIEVKATRSPGDTVRIFLTRNEITTGLADANWRLVVVRCNYDRSQTILGHTSARMLLHMLPTDRHSRGRWRTATLRLAVAELQPGLPAAQSLRAR